MSDGSHNFTQTSPCIRCSVKSPDFRTKVRAAQRHFDTKRRRRSYVTEIFKPATEISSTARKTIQVKEAQKSHQDMEIAQLILVLKSVNTTCSQIVSPGIFSIITYELYSIN